MSQQLLHGLHGLVRKVDLLGNKEASCRSRLGLFKLVAWHKDCLDHFKERLIVEKLNELAVQFFQTLEARLMLQVSDIRS
jgi:hypothetical protein